MVTAGIVPTAAAASGVETPGTDGLCTACPALCSSFFPRGKLLQAGWSHLVPAQCEPWANSLYSFVNACPFSLFCFCSHGNNREGTGYLIMKVQSLLGKKMGKLKKIGSSKKACEGRSHFPQLLDCKTLGRCGCLSPLLTFGEECVLVVKAGLGIQISSFLLPGV